jgi:hypothetical protein
MAKITRKTQKIFASTAGATGITEYGSPAAGLPVYTTDVAQVQTAEWLDGWAAAALAGSEIPTFQDFNGIHYVMSSQVGYLLQEGIPEYDVATTYYANSIVKKAGTYELYGSIINNNLGNALPSAVSNANWEYLGALGETANPISWGGTAGGTANALTLTPSTALTAYTAGQVIAFLPASNNTGAVTVNISALGTKDITKNGTIALTANELVAGKVQFAIYDGTQFQLINTNAFAKGADVASASTINLTSTTGNIIDVTGTTTITAVTLPEGQVRYVRFTGILTLTHGASLVLPSGANITTAAGDYAIFIGYASGVVRTIYQRQSGLPIVAKAPVKIDFTSSGTYTPTAGMTSCFVRVQAGGAGGGGVGTANPSIGAAGGAGGYAEGVFTAATIGASQVVTVGAAGAAGASGSLSAGGTGGTSSLGSLVAANGGVGASGSSGNAQVGSGLGGTATAGSTQIAGGAGYNGMSNGGTASLNYSGQGGTAVMGAGGRGVTSAGTAGSAAPAGYGGGGSGAYGNGSGLAGGAGGAGFITIIEYFN